jgi:hypothetical protein
MDKNTFIAYRGIVYTIEWYYDERGRSQPYKYYIDLSDMQKRKVLLLFKRIGDFGQINDITKFRYEGNDIFAFKPKPDRFLSFFVKGSKIIVACGFYKNTQKLPQEEKERAIRCRNDYHKRVKEGKYYE